MVNVVEYREDEAEVKGENYERVFHVGAVDNKLDELKATLETKFDSPPKFDSERFGYEDKNIEYTLQGTVKGVPYYVSLQHISCPTPIIHAQIHHAVVEVPIGKNDKISHLIIKDFKRYEVEMDEKIKELELNLEKAYAKEE